MGSVLDDVRREDFAAYAAMSPSARLALSERLGEEALAALMSAHGCDRAAAERLSSRSRRVGRRPTRCLDEDPPQRLS
jgi:hypothetical protein